MLNIVKSILPRVHWSAEELAEGAFVVRENATKPMLVDNPTVIGAEKIVLEGVNKTITAVLDFLGDTTRGVVNNIIAPGSQTTEPFPPISGHKGSGVSPATPPSTPVPSEVMVNFKSRLLF